MSIIVKNESGANYTPQNLINKGFRYSPSVEGHCDEFMEHIKAHLCDFNKELFEFIIDYCAELYQPAKKEQNKILLLAGEKGLGKSLFVNILNDLFTDNQTIALDDIREIKYLPPEHLTEIRLVTCEDVDWTDFNEIWPTIKQILSSGSQFRIILTTHRIDKINLRGRHQHFIPLRIRNHFQEGGLFLEDMLEQLETKGGYSRLVEVFINRDISSRNFTLQPETLFRDMLLMQNLSEVETYIFNSLILGKEKEPTDLFNTAGKSKYIPWKSIFDFVPESGGKVDTDRLLHNIRIWGTQSGNYHELSIEELQTALISIFGDVLEQNGSTLKVSSIQDWRNKFREHTGLRAEPEQVKKLNWS